MECRTCLNITNDFQGLFTEDCDLPHKIEAISSIQILDNEHYPSQICHSCVTNVELLYDFCNIVKRSNTILENRDYSSQNEETGENGNHGELEDDLIQIDEIKLESETDNSDLDDSVPVKKNVKKVEVLRKTKRKTKEKKKSVKEKIYECTKCDFTAEQNKFLKIHQKSHKVENEPQTVCNICGKLVKTEYLRQHLFTHNFSPVTCYICEKVLKHKDSLRRHLRRHKVVTIQCTHCDKIYDNKQSYYMHLRRHKNAGAKPFKCPMCEKLFRMKKFLTKHIRSHTGERPFPCEYCKKGFSSPYALKTHIRQHTNEKPFACEFCDMAFTVRVSLKTHVKSKHPDKALQ